MLFIYLRKAALFAKATFADGVLVLSAEEGMEVLLPSYRDARKRRVERFGLGDQSTKKVLQRERCFILGMGPSLAKIDPKALNDEFVIGTNFILKTDFVPDLVCVVDNRRFDFDNWKKSQIKVITVSAIAERRREQISDLNVYHDIEYVDYGAGLTRSVLKIKDYDAKLRSVNFAGSVITDLAIPFACYLGFKEIYVLGLDGAVASFPSTHIIGNESNYSAAHPSHMFHMHEKAAMLAEKRGTKVYNASPGGVVWAFDRVPMENIKPTAVRKSFDRDVDGKFVVFAGRLLRLIRAGDGYRIFDPASSKFIRHKNNIVQLDKDDESETFLHDSTFQIEPSFVKPDWLSFRSSNGKGRYITSLDETTGYKLRKVDDMFSPYFSSFRVYDSEARATQRLQSDNAIRDLAKIKLSIGNSLLADDKL